MNRRLSIKEENTFLVTNSDDLQDISDIMLTLVDHDHHDRSENLSQENPDFINIEYIELTPLNYLDDR